MMFIHHFFTFPFWWGAGISYPLVAKLAPYFCQPMRMCVPVFCFLKGYFYYFNTNRTYRYSFRKITDLLVSYWCVFLPLAAVAAVCLDYPYTTADFIKELLGLYCPTMSFWFMISLDVIYAPLFIYALANLCKMIQPKYVHLVLSRIGKYSLLMWFVSCMFFDNCKTLFQPVLYFPHNPVLVTLWGLLLCYNISSALDLVVSRINKAKNRLL